MMFQICGIVAVFLFTAKKKVPKTLRRQEDLPKKKSHNS